MSTPGETLRIINGDTMSPLIIRNAQDSDADLIEQCAARNTPELHARMVAAWRTGETCGACGRLFETLEPAALCEWVDRTARYRYRSWLVPVCLGCMVLPSLARPWRLRGEVYDCAFKPIIETACDACRRPLRVVLDRRRRHVCCSDRCLQKVKKTERIARRAFTCATCGAAFQPARTDSRYCSGACRQKAYRARGVQERPGPLLKGKASVRAGRQE